MITKTEEVLAEMKGKIDGLLTGETQPLQVRLFIFEQEMKNIFFYQNLPFIKGLQVILEAIFRLQHKIQINFAIICMRSLALFLES